MKVNPATAGFSQERSDEAESEERGKCVKSLDFMANSALAARAEEDSDEYSSNEGHQGKNKHLSEDPSSNSEEDKADEAPASKRKAIKEKKMRKRGDSEDEEAQPELPKDEE
jgi:hypothetical protein